MLRRSAALIEAVAAIGITAVVIGGAALVVGRAREIEDRVEQGRAIARLEEGLRLALQEGWRSRVTDTDPDDGARQRVAALLEYEGVVSLVLVRTGPAGDQAAAELREAPGPVGGFRPVGRLITAPERLVDAFGVDQGSPPGPARAIVVEPLDESVDAGIPAGIDFSWEVENEPGPVLTRDLAEVDGPLIDALTIAVRDGGGGNGQDNGNGVLERPLRGAPPPAPLLLSDAQLDGINDPVRDRALRAWLSERLGRPAESGSLSALVGVERRAWRRRRLARDRRDPFRKLGWRIEGARFALQAPPALGPDLDRLSLQVAVYGDVVKARSGDPGEPLRVFEVELRP